MAPSLLAIAHMERMLIRRLMLMGVFALGAGAARAETPHQVIGNKAKQIGKSSVADFQYAVKQAMKTAKKIQQSEADYEQYPSVSIALDLLIHIKDAGNAISEANAHKALLGEHVPYDLVKTLHKAMRRSNTVSPEVIIGKKASVLDQIKNNSVGQKMLTDAGEARELIDSLVEGLPGF
jgi:hypothetical protein